jgi:hypothetical protein
LVEIAQGEITCIRVFLTEDEALEATGVAAGNR